MSEDKTHLERPESLLTNEATDTEAGNERLDTHADIDKALEALEAMYQRGLVSDGEYNERRGELDAMRGEIRTS